MLKQFILSSFINELKLVAAKSPRTEKLQELIQAANLRQLSDQGEKDPQLHLLAMTPVVSSTERWSEVLYQSLYVRDGDPSNRLVLQEPASLEPTVCVMVLKAARLAGESGLVYCGTREQLEAFKAKLPTYEQLAIELDEKDFVRCLVEVAEKEFQLKIIYQQVSLEHGGDEDYYEDLED